MGVLDGDKQGSQVMKEQCNRLVQKSAVRHQGLTL